METSCVLRSAHGRNTCIEPSFIRYHLHVNFPRQSTSYYILTIPREDEAEKLYVTVIFLEALRNLILYVAC
jgi:hypothetical protein